MKQFDRRIKTFEQLQDVEDKAFEDACSADLFFVRHAFGCIDGYFLVVSCDDTLSMAENTYILDYKDFEKWTDIQKQLFKERYGFLKYD